MTKSIRVPMAALAPGERALTPDQARYVVGVHRLRAGARFVAFDPRTAIECDAELVSPTRARLGETRAAPILPARAITWMHGLPKGDKCDAIVRDATELGATRVIFVQTERVVSRADEKKIASRVERWAKIADEAARQCGRGDTPAVLFRPRWEEGLAALEPDSHRFCLHPSGTSLGDAFLAARDAKAIICAAGPEGGFTDDEVAIARTHGFAIVSLGALVLRTETVPAAVLGALMMLASVDHG